jgi:hypothetical protein
MFRPNSRSSSDTTNCVKYKGECIKIAVWQMRSQFYNIFVMLHLCIVFITTVFKIGNADVVSVMVNWASEWVISSLCGILKRFCKYWWVIKQAVRCRTGIDVILHSVSKKIMGQHLDQAMTASYQIHSHPLLVRYSVLYSGSYWPRCNICYKWKHKPVG